MSRPDHDPVRAAFDKALRRPSPPAADAPMVQASRALHEMFLSLMAGGFTEAQAVAFTAHYLAAQGKTQDGGGA